MNGNKKNKIKTKTKMTTTTKRHTHTHTHHFGAMKTTNIQKIINKNFIINILSIISALYNKVDPRVFDSQIKYILY